MLLGWLEGIADLRISCRWACRRTRPEKRAWLLGCAVGRDGWYRWWRESYGCHFFAQVLAVGGASERSLSRARNRNSNLPKLGADPPEARPNPTLPNFNGLVSTKTRTKTCPSEQFRSNIRSKSPLLKSRPCEGHATVSSMAAAAYRRAGCYVLESNEIAYFYRAFGSVSYRRVLATASEQDGRSGRSMYRTMFEQRLHGC